MPGMAKQTFNFRLNPDSRDWVNAIAADTGVTPTDVIRVALAMTRVNHERDLLTQLRALAAARAS